MSGSVFITTVISMSAFMLASVLGVAYFMSNVLGDRISDLGGRIARVESRLDHLEDTVQGLREDVAVLKATP